MQCICKHASTCPSQSSVLGEIKISRVPNFDISTVINRFKDLEYSEIFQN